MKEKNIMKKSFSLSASVIRKNRISFCIWLMEILLLFILSAFFVPTVDDLIFRFSFEYHSVREFFHYVIYYGNGRLLGNAFVLFFSRHTALFYALQTILFAVFSVVLEKCVALPYSRHYVFLYFIFQPLPVWNSTFSWMSSFINYYFPLILLAVVLLLLKKYFQAQIKHVNLWLPALFFAGVAMQLFNELNAAVNILVAFLLCLLFKRRKRKMLAPVLLFVSNLVGFAGTMLFTKCIDFTKTFSYQNAFRQDTFSNQNYRQTIFSVAPGEYVRMLFYNFKFPFFLFSTFILLYISVLALVLYVACKKKQYSLKLKTGVAASVLTYVPPCLFSMIVIHKYPFDLPDQDSKFLAVMILMLLLFCVSCFILAVLFYTVILKHIPHCSLSLISFSVGAVSYLPFLVVYPGSYRCCICMLFFFLTAYLIALRDVSKMYGFDLFRLSAFCAAAVSVVMVLYTCLYAREKKIYHYRDQYYMSSVVLPENNTVIVMGGGSQEPWDEAAGFTHQFVSFEEFKSVTNLS